MSDKQLSCGRTKREQPSLSTPIYPAKDPSTYPTDKKAKSALLSLFGLLPCWKKVESYRAVCTGSRSPYLVTVESLRPHGIARTAKPISKISHK